jgi:hypothetical protein
VKRVAPALIVVAVSAAAEPTSIDQIRTEFSPQADIVVQHCWRRAGGEQIWLALADDFGKRRLLFDTGRNAGVMFSQDEEWLVVNDRWGSNGSSARLYKKVAPLDYREQLDLTGGAWDFFAQHEKVSPPQFDHSYTEAIRWIAKPAAIVLELSGHMDHNHHVGGWLCIYYIDSKEFSTDFDALNKQQVTLRP